MLQKRAIVEIENFLQKSTTTSQRISMIGSSLLSMLFIPLKKHITFAEVHAHAELQTMICEKHKHEYTATDGKRIQYHF